MVSFLPKGCFRKLSPILCTEASRGDLGDWRCETPYQDPQHGLWGLMQKEKVGPPCSNIRKTLETEKALNRMWVPLSRRHMAARSPPSKLAFRLPSFLIFRNC